MCPACFWYKIKPHWQSVLAAVFITAVLAALFISSALAS